MKPSMWRHCIVSPQVETVGDVYMVAAGAPEANKDHAVMMSNLALDMVHYIKDIKDPGDEGSHVQIRIGKSRVSCRKGPICHA